MKLRFLKTSFIFLNLFFFISPRFGFFTCADIEKVAQKKIEGGREYQAADDIEACLSTLPQNSSLYSFLGKHYHRRKQYQRSLDYYQIYFQTHTPTFTEKMIVVHNYFSLQNFSSIENFIQKNFPQPPEEFTCENFYAQKVLSEARDEEYLCYLKKFQTYGITQKSFENFLNCNALRAKSTRDITFWHEVGVGIFPHKRMYQALAMFLYQSRQLEKSLSVYNFLEKNFSSAHDDEATMPKLMIEQILREQGKMQNRR